jgi:hypothetical protein
MPRRCLIAGDLGPVRYPAVYQVARAGLRICMSHMHKRKERCERSRPRREPRDGGVLRPGLGSSISPADVHRAKSY